MAEEMSGALALESTEHIPIAQLSPELSTPSTRSIKAVVTLTWPYSSAASSVAFLLAEPDFRLRCARGQVRVRFSGSSAKAVAKCGIQSGDEVTVCLDGAEWLPDNETVAAPGRGIEWELKFTERLLLQFKQDGVDEIKRIDIDHPALVEEVAIPARIPITEPAEPVSPTDNGIAANNSLMGIMGGDLWSSPAFLKRARTSYGSMFESDFDPFGEEDGTVRGKGRKKTRLSTTSWKYTSRSPSPEADEPQVEDINTAPGSAPKLPPMMADEGCQTVNLDGNDATEGMAQTMADLSPQATSVGGATHAVPPSPAFLNQAQMQVDTPFLASPNDLPQLNVIRTQYPNQEAEEPSFETPSSPRLQPVHSDSLQLVSPLVSSKYGQLQHNEQLEAEGEQRPPIIEPETSVMNSALSADVEPVEEDIYGASPAGRRDQDQGPEFPSFRNAVDDQSGVGNASVDGQQYASENQYGQWKSGGVLSSHPGSRPSNELFTEEGRFCENIEGYSTLDEGLLEASTEMPLSEYPPLGEGLSGQVTSGWGASSVAYPDLPESSAYPLPPPFPSAILRPQNGPVAPAIDFTERNDEVATAIPLEILEDEMAASAAEEEIGAEGREETVNIQQHGRVGNQHDSPKEDYSPESFEGSQLSAHDEGGGYGGDTEMEELHEEVYHESENWFSPSPDPQSDLGDQDCQGSYSEESEEGSYGDESEEEELQRPPPARPQKLPEVIDLLSSDDDEETPKSPAMSTRRHSPTSLPQTSADYPLVDAESDEEDDERGEARESEEYDSLPYAKRSINGASGENEIDDDGSEDSESDLQPYADEQDSNLDAAEVRTPEAVEEMNVVEVQIPVKSVANETPMPTKVARGGSDGVNNEPRFEASYNSLSVAQPPPQPSIFLRRLSQDQDHKTSSVDHGQLPTPEDTQISNSMNSTEVSFSSASEHRHKSREVLQDDEIDMDQTDEVTNKVEATKLKSIFVEQTQNVLGPGVSQEESIEIEEVVTSTIRFEEQDQLEEDPEGEVANDDVQLVPTEWDESAKIVEASHTIEMQESREVTEDEITETVVITETRSVFIEEPEASATLGGGLVLYDGAADSSSEEARDDGSDAAEEQETANDSSRRSTRSADPPIQVVANTEENIRPATPIETTNTTENINSVSPRKSTTKSPASTNENICPVTPARSSGAPPAISDTDGLSPMVVIDAHAAPKGHDASIEIALEAADSPSSPRHNVRKPRAAASEASDSSLPKHNLRNRQNTTSEAAEISPLNKHNLRTSHVASSPLQHNLRNHTVAAESPPAPQHNLRNAHIDTSEVASSSPPQHNPRKTGAELKLRLTRALRTELSEFTPLKVLRYHLNKKLDVLAVATTTPPEPQRAKGGPRHYQVTFNVTDPSTAPSGVTEIQVFRPYKDALPIIKAGDGILLRNFQVIALSSRGFALRSHEEASSWAVFKGDDEVEVRGPPVEYGDGEKRHFEQLKTWYESLDETGMAKISRANGDKAAGSAAGKH
ncbi:uncharacterized protein L3040_002775 [Drepanopeziza brunnea f. sp. 'multigermtubi']|uniref:3-dehydroshikimate dehydratase n=1 Tax=Marssonina brunnea f. sp. multigermtubi (strain MB_m1) TaxID=1072389 RepID=K1W868_MARBU|nr:3-dehydroshikimate dehydratase [Drepanopeziza brunnea f. sp. 'multigermtubi' MB_m1]EKD13365.1 3-dehydroshikimate dehydratase [Drepanopeziza brunnea f. sp. 'multigermtubi' MB_m1]KAJ5050907.1 hypothetical protein L3040_002775 [Drepanopeziza brunnea f. sp. 'multigermtubi']